MLILNFSNLVVRIKFLIELEAKTLETPICWITYLGKTLLISIATSHGGPQLKISLQISYHQMVIC
jgi:hypothetical protein